MSIEDYLSVYSFGGTDSSKLNTTRTSSYYLMDNMVKAFMDVHVDHDVFEIPTFALNGVMDALSKEIMEKGAAEPTQTFELPLMGDTRILKGKKVIAVRCNGEEILVGTWKKAVGEILKICNQDASCHAALLKVRGKIAGKNRMILSESTEGMNSPLKIDEGLFFEAHYDTDALFYMLKKRIFPEIGFDGSNITIVYKLLWRQ